MKILRTPRLLSMFSVILVSCMLLTSCGLIPEGAAAGIKKTVASYMDAIQDGSFSDDDYESSYAVDTAFSDLAFADEAVKTSMEKGFTKITYKIDAATGSTKAKTGTCDLTVTAIDVEKVITSFEDGKMDADSLLEAIKSKKAPTKDYEITLSMSYDSTAKKWFVDDSSPLVDFLGTPYAEVSFGPAAGDPAIALDTFMTALNTGDTETIDILSPNYASDQYFDVDANMKEMVQAFYSNLTYELDGEPEITDDTAAVNTTLSMPDLTTIINDVSNDLDFMSTIMKPYVLASINNEDTTTQEEDMTIAFANKIVEILKSESYPIYTTAAVFDMTKNQDTGTWELAGKPDAFSDFDIQPTTSDDVYTKAAIMALESLYKDGSINQATYDQYIAAFDGSNSSQTDGPASPASDVDTTGWYDYNNDTYVTEYDSTITSTIEYDITFINEWPGLVIYYEYYNMGGTVLIKSSTELIPSGQNYVYLPLEMEDGSMIPADTYMINVYLEDGTIVMQDSVAVY